MNNIGTIRNTLAHNVGQRVTTTIYAPRNVIIRQSGILSKVFPSLFVVDIDKEDNPKSVDRVSYLYSDILTGDIELQFEN